MVEIFEHLGRIYQGYRVLQDSGIWLLDVEGMAHYFFSRLVTAAMR